MLYLGLDIGTGKICALAVDMENGKTAGMVSASNDAAMDSEPGRAEQDPLRIRDICFNLLQELAELPEVKNEVAGGIGLTGQMHGLLLCDEKLAPLTPLYTWQDQRIMEAADGKRSYMDMMSELCRSAGISSPAPAPGYGGATLFRLLRDNTLPSGAVALTIHGYIAACLCRTTVIDTTDAAAWGLLDMQKGGWNRPMLKALRLPEEILPSIRPSGAVMGSLSSSTAERLGLRHGIPVCTPLGDNQAGFVGSVDLGRPAPLLNLGTGGQISIPSWLPSENGSLDNRPMPGGGYLLVGASLCGGRAYAWLENFFKAVGRDVFGLQAEEPLFNIMNSLAAVVPAGAGGLSVSTLFAGTRSDPEAKGAITGIDRENFTPATLCRGVIEGMVDELYGYFLQAETRLEAEYIAGSGNGVRRNPVLRRYIEDRFGSVLKIPAHNEEAAFGAALAAAVGTGFFKDFKEAGRVIGYLE
ncbi:MAG: FGGY family carbohydrate kinase [bacterium]|nr:FGGY family carbohydrate kinase [bacterium]